MRTSRKRQVLAALAASGMVAATAPVASAAIEVAENLLVNLDASTLTPGPITSWANTGSLGGAFTNDFLALNSNTMAGPIGGISRGVIFTGNDALVSDVIAPAGVTGIDPTRSIEVWAYNPGISGEEAMVSWAKRGQAGGPGGPDATGSAMQFNYGTSGAFGAATHWGAPDIGWGAGGPPARGVWHHLTYTFEGAGGAAGSTPTTRVYIDGVQANQEVLAPGAINTWGGLYPFRLGAALAGNEANLEIFASLALAKVRVHDGVLAPTQILNNYNEERAGFITPPPPVPTAKPLQRGPKHRYSFHGTGGDGAQIFDSAGGAHGTLKTLDNVSALNGAGQMSLAGGASATAGYADLPNGLISSLTEVTMEAWVTPTGNLAWMRLADFGSTTAGEHAGPGGGGTGADYLFMSITRGTNINQKRFEIANNDAVGGGAGGINTADVNIASALGQQQHLVLVYSPTSEFGVPEIRAYVNGVLLSSANTEILLSNLNDVNNWLGRSNYTGDANFQGLFDEFRLYDRALSSDEVLGNAEVGPAIVNLATLPAWAADAGGNWSAPASWANGVPNGVDVVARLGDTITAERQVTVDAPMTVGGILFQNDNRYNVTGPGRVTLSASAGNDAALVATRLGNHVISAPVTLASDTVVDVRQAAATLAVRDLADTDKQIRKLGAGTFEANRIRATALHVESGKVRLTPGGGTSALSRLVLAGTTDAWTGTLDVNDSGLVLRAADATAGAEVLARSVNQLRQSRDATTGPWTGAGLTSSLAAANEFVGLAVVPNPGLTEFGGVTLGPDDVIVKATYNGDADLSGDVNLDDYFAIDSNFLTPPENPTYAQGDFNYDGEINLDDYFLIDSAFLGQGAPMTGAAAAAAVPEPATAIGLLGLLTLGMSRSVVLSGRRRRRVL